MIVDFLEGDPGPADHHRPRLQRRADAALRPAGRTDAERRSRRTAPRAASGFNELRFEDKKGDEQIFIHAEKDMDVRVKNDAMEHVVNDRHLIVGSEKDKKGDQNELVHGNKSLNVKKDHVEKIEGNMQLTSKGDGGNQDIVIGANKKELVEADSDLHVKGDQNEKVDGTVSLTIGEKQQQKVGTNHALEAGQEIHIKGGMKVIIEAGMQLTIKGAGGFVDIGPAGVTIQGTMVMINSGGAAGAGSGSSPKAPQDAKEAEPTEPTDADNAKTGSKSTNG